MKKLFLLMVALTLTVGIAGAQGRFAKSLFKASGETLAEIVPC